MTVAVAHSTSRMRQKEIEKYSLRYVKRLLMPLAKSQRWILVDGNFLSNPQVRLRLSSLTRHLSSFSKQLTEKSFHSQTTDGSYCENIMAAEERK
jgi:hypothetical protein